MQKMMAKIKVSIKCKNHKYLKLKRKRKKNMKSNNFDELNSIDVVI